MKKLIFVSVLVILFGFVSQGVAQESYLIKVSAFTPEEIGILSSSGIKAYAKTADYYLAEATSQNLDYLRSSGISYEILDDEPEYSLYYFVFAKPGEDISRYLDQIKEKATVLDAKGEKAVIKGHPRRIEELTSFGLELRLIKKKPLPLKSETQFPSISKAKALAYDPLIAEIIGKVTTSELAGWDSSLSGEHPVTIGGNPDTLLTRYTYTDKCDRAAQYLKAQFESFGLTAWYDTFTIATNSLIQTMDMVCTPTGDTAWLGEFNSGMWKTTDAGEHWYYKSNYYYGLRALSAPTPETLYGAGYYGLIIKSTDGGESWSQLSSPDTTYYRGIYFFNGQRGFVSGYGGTILYTTDGGQNWTNKTSGTSYNLYGITFIDEFEGWVVGQNGTILHTTDRGDSWTSQTSGTTGIILEVEFATSKKGWVCGYGGYLRYTSNAGTNWVAQTSGTTQNLYKVSAPDSMKVWVAGWGRIILHTTNAGSNWSSQASNPNSGSYCAVLMVDTLKGWAAGYYDDVMYTTDAGQTWVQQGNNTYPRVTKLNVVAVLPGQTQPGKECLIVAHYDDRSENPTNYAPGADDNASGTAAVLTAAHILKDYQFDYTLKFVGFAGEEQGLLGSAAYAEKAQQRGDTIVGVYNFDMIAWEGNDDNVIELHAGTGPTSGALADIMIGVISDYSLPLVTQKITSGATTASDHASFWAYGFPAILGIEDYQNSQDFNPAYHTTGDRISIFDMPYFTNFSKAGIASLAIIAQPVPQFKYGDANGDGKVTVSDAIYLINYLFKGGPAPVPFESGDTNCDGKVTVADVIYLINYLFKGGPEPVC